jgi:hypothetical protein
VRIINGNIIYEGGGAGNARGRVSPSGTVAVSSLNVQGYDTLLEEGGRHQAGIECRFHSATFNGSKIKFVLRYTLSALGFLSNQRKVAAAQRLSLIRSPDAPI